MKIEFIEDWCDLCYTEWLKTEPTLDPKMNTNSLSDLYWQYKGQFRPKVVASIYGLMGGPVLLCADHLKEITADMTGENEIYFDFRRWK